MNEEEGQGQRLRFSTPSGGLAGTKTLGQDEVQCALAHEESRHCSCSAGDMSRGCTLREM